MDAGKAAEARVQFEMVVQAAPENLAAIRALAILHERDTAGDDGAAARGGHLRRYGARHAVRAGVVPRGDSENPGGVAKSAHPRRQLT